MKWEVITERKRHVVESNSSAGAVADVSQHDDSGVKSVKLLPKTMTGKIKRTWRNWFGK